MNDALLGPARALLGAEVAWGNAAVTALLALGLSLGLSLLSVLSVTPRALRADPEMPWPERARLAMPVRLVAVQLAVILPMLGALLGWVFAGPLGALSPAAMAALGALCAALPVWTVRGLIERAVRDPVVAAWRSVRGQLVWQLLLFPHFWVALGLAAAMPASQSEGLPAPTLAALTLGMALFVAGAMGGGLRLAAALRLVRPDPRLDSALARAAQGAGLAEVPRGYVVGVGVANAFAFPWLGAVGVTAPAMALLSDDELVAVCAHELAHLHESRAVRALRLLTIVLLATPLVTVRPVLAAYGVLAFDALLVGCVLMLVVTRRTMRAMEERADRAAHGQQVSPGDYARALEALYRGNLMPVVMSGRRKVHPDLYDRMVAAGVTPPYPRPEAPKRWPGAVTVLGALLAALAVGASVRWGLGQATGGTDEDRLRAVLITGGAGRSLGDLAWRRYHDGKVDEAVTLYRAALAAEPHLSWNAANLTVVLANTGRCAEAAEAYRVMESRRRSTGSGARVEAEARRALVDCASQRVMRLPGPMRGI